MNADRCDAHGFCWSCLQQYVEIKIMDDGCWNLACPGVGCKYHLVSDDIELILRGSRERDTALDQYKSLCSESGNSRMLEALVLALEDKKESWILNSLQACPKCLLLAQRHDGCPHLVCRCGCDFCFGCGADYGDSIEVDGERMGCLCEHLDGVRLGAWLAFKGCEPSLRECLEKVMHNTPLVANVRHQRRMREARERVRLEERFRSNIALLSSWLWFAGATVEQQIELPSTDAHEDYAMLASHELDLDVDSTDIGLSDLEDDMPDRLEHRVRTNNKRRKISSPLNLSSGTPNNHKVKAMRQNRLIMKTHEMRHRQRQRKLHAARCDKML